jgi:peptidyl-tRNA hydrolase, PTH1 family
MAWRRKGAQERRGTPVDYLIVGLANPGAEYEGTRHNIGGAVVARLAQRHGGSLKIEPRQKASLCEVTIGEARVGLAIPTTYMNESGEAFPGLIDRTGIEQPEQLIVVHDELDLDPGRLQLKIGGGSAGHNGLKSITSALKSPSYFRLRIGVGKPPHRDAGANWVLSKPKGADAVALGDAVDAAADALDAVVRLGPERAMESINARGR